MFSPPFHLSNHFPAVVIIFSLDVSAQRGHNRVKVAVFNLIVNMRV
jgi:hypothetical protein